MFGYISRDYVLAAVTPIVQHGVFEKDYTSVSHAMYETAAAAFLMGRGYDFFTARRIVESWEINESFPPFQYTPGYFYPNVI